DAGDVLATRLFALKSSDSLDRVIKETKCEGARLLIGVLGDLRADRAQSRPLDMKQASYFSFPKPADVREFRKRGHRPLQGVANGELDHGADRLRQGRANPGRQPFVPYR